MSGAVEAAEAEASSSAAGGVGHATAEGDGAPTERKQPRQYKWLVELEPAVPGDGALRPSLSPVYRHIWSAGGFPPAPLGAATCYDIWHASVQRNGSAPCLGWRKVMDDGRPGPYTFISYSEAEQQVGLLSAGLAAAGLRQGDKVAVYAANCPEWMIVLQACNRMSYICVPVYDTLGRDAVQFVVNHSGARVLFVSSEKMRSASSALDHITAPLVLLVHWGPRPMGHLEPASPTAADATGFGAPFGTGGRQSQGQSEVSYVRQMTFSELLKAGSRAGAVPPQPPQPEDLTSIMYTSGTTGEPKGVQLPHSAVVAAVASLAAALEHYDEPVGPGDSMLSYLPLAHIFDRVSEETSLAAGACIGYWSGDVTRVGEDAAALKPSVFVGVPRVYDKVYETVQHRLSGVNWLRRSIFRTMYDRRLKILRGGGNPNAATLQLPLPLPDYLVDWLHWGRRGGGPRGRLRLKQQHDDDNDDDNGSGAAHGSAPGLGLGFVDSIVFGRIRRGLGGRLRLVVSGGAPLSPRVEEFLRVALGAPVSQGYGLTETCAASFMQEPYHWEQFGSVGPPLLCTEFRLRSIPDMGYLAEGGGEQCGMPAGELLLRGPQLFTGYYRRPDMTREALVPEPGNLPPEAAPAASGGAGGEAESGGAGFDPRRGRWFCTGDIAALRPDGSVEIVDRIKNMFKLSQGEYVSPEHLEAVYGEADVVEQVWVYGDSHKNALVAVVVPERRALMSLVRRIEIKGATAVPTTTANTIGANEGKGTAAAPAGPTTAGDAGADEGGDTRVYGNGEAATLLATLCQSPGVVPSVLQQLQEVGRTNQLRGFEIVRAVHMVPEPFSPENGMMTATLKLRRPALLRRFRTEIDEMYEQLSRS